MFNLPLLQQITVRGTCTVRDKKIACIFFCFELISMLHNIIVALKLLICLQLHKTCSWPYFPKPCSFAQGAMAPSFVWFSVFVCDITLHYITFAFAFTVYRLTFATCHLACTVYHVPCTMYHVPCNRYHVPCTWSLDT